MSENEDKYHDTVLDLEAKLKKNVDLILKLGNSLQGMFMLGPKPLSVYDQQLKHGLGYPNPYTLKQAISQCLKLYLASSLGNSEISLHVRDTEDTLDEASKNFVPQKELSAEQLYFPYSFIPSDKNSNATPSIPTSMPISKPKIDVGSTLKANDKVSSTKRRNMNSRSSGKNNRSLLRNGYVNLPLVPWDVFLVLHGCLDCYVECEVVVQSNMRSASITPEKSSLKIDGHTLALENEYFASNHRLHGVYNRGNITLCQFSSDHSNFELLHMRFMRFQCGVASINGKKYILVIVDDYSRYTWVYFLHSKDETPEIIKKFIAQAQLNYKAKVCKIRTDNGTEFKNATLKAHYEKLGIMQQFSTA
ncbi:retrovirus-related pol polyprotein from transposon TNT 1-94 [Tanacetum coccineum]